MGKNTQVFIFSIPAHPILPLSQHNHSKNTMMTLTVSLSTTTVLDSFSFSVCKSSIYYRMKAKKTNPGVFIIIIGWLVGYFFFQFGLLSEKAASQWKYYQRNMEKSG